MDFKETFSTWQAKDFPEDLGRALAEAIKTVDPVDQLDATGCVLANTIMERDRLREINAELLAALESFIGNGPLHGECEGAIGSAPLYVRYETLHKVRQLVTRAKAESHE